MRASTRYYLFLATAVIAYLKVSKLIFDKVYDTSQVVVDELFHIPQGLSFCNGNFSYWDPKITTLPGLHLVSTAAISYFSCNTYNLRLVNLGASCVNLILFSFMLRYIYGSYNESQSKIVLQALSLTIMPPLYFFSHVYYTDTLSLLFLLVFSRLCIHFKGKWLIFIFGNLCVLMRQTNIVWVAMVFGHKLLDMLIRSSRVYGNRYLTKSSLSKRSLIANDIDASKLKRYYAISDVITALRFHVTTCFRVAFKYVPLSDIYAFIQLKGVLVSFLLFLYFNGSIVVGDKSAHVVTIHLPQLLYFLLFYGVFGLPYVLAKFVSTIKLIYNNKIIAVSIVIIFVLIVHFNTIVHPYLLADNRHYTFYVWNRWFGKYAYARYVTTAAYVFLLFSLYDNLRDQNCVSFLLPYCVCLFFALGLQSLLEIRYFLVPYIILRLRFVKPSYKMVLFEFVWYVLINVVTFHIFFTKILIWEDFDDIQRIIW